MIRRLAILFVCTALAFTAAFALSPSASAQSEEPSIEDFIDEDGEVDFEGYTAALNAFFAQGDGSRAGGLPATGSDDGSLIAVGAGLVLLGGSAVIWARSRRTLAED